MRPAAPTPGHLAMFDLDNTLIDRQGAYARWAERFAAAEGLERGAVEFLLEVDRDGFASREEVFAPAKERFGLAESVEELIAAYRADYPRCIKPEPEVAAALERLRARGWRLAIVTNGPPSQHEKVARAGLAGLFDAACVSEEIGAAKPDRAIFEEAARRCGVQLDGSDKLAGWMVGDAPGPDVGGGRGAGLRTIWLHRGRRWPLEEYRPDASAGSLHEAVEILLGA